MTEEFEERDLSGASFLGVRLRGATFRDVDFTGVRTHHVLLHDVEFDGTVDRLVVNGVDVTDHVNANDPWQPLRGMTEPATAGEVRRSWSGLSTAWNELADEVRRRGDGAAQRSVDGEWTFVQTVRHLVFVADKWILGPLADGAWHTIGLPNSGSQAFPWPAIDLAADPTLDEALSVWAAQGAEIESLAAGLTDTDLDSPVEILENGRARGRHCWWALFEELFEHRRYALRDLG